MCMMWGLHEQTCLICSAPALSANTRIALTHAARLQLRVLFLSGRRIQRIWRELYCSEYAAQASRSARNPRSAPPAPPCASYPSTPSSFPPPPVAIPVTTLEGKVTVQSLEYLGGEGRPALMAARSLALQHMRLPMGEVCRVVSSKQ